MVQQIKCPVDTCSGNILIQASLSEDYGLAKCHMCKISGYVDRKTGSFYSDRFISFLDKDGKKIRSQAVYKLTK